MDAFHDVFGPDRILVDSSKTLKALSTWTACARSADIDVRTLYCVRDVRPWTVYIKAGGQPQREFRVLSILDRAVWPA